MYRFCLLLLSVWMIFAASISESAAARPNVILIMVDDMGFSDLGCYGGEIETPHLDALAKNGVRLTNFYNTAKCSESRATLLSGQYFPEVKLMAMQNCVTIAEAMKQGGYATYMAGKWHLNGNPVERGFDRYFGHLSGATNFFTGNDSFRLDDKPFEVPETGFYTTDANLDYATKFIDSTPDGKPYFLYLAFNAPHYPLQAPEADVKKYLGKYRIGWDKLRQQRHAKQLELGIVSNEWPLSPRPDDVPAWETLNEDQKWEHDLTMATFAAMVDRVDQNIGKLITKLKERNEFDNTLILFMSDNGGCPFQRTTPETRQQKLMPWNPKSYWTYDKGWAHACNTPFRLYKQNQHEGGISSPLIAHWPQGIQQTGTISNELSHLVDIFPTCLEVSGLSYPESHNGKPIGKLRGKSLAPIFAGNKRESHEELFFLFGNLKNRALREANWKLVSYDYKPWELYQINKDRTELQNLAKEEPTRTMQMIARWEELNRSMNGPKGKPNKGGKKNPKKEKTKTP